MRRRKETDMARVLLGIIAVFVLVGGYSIFQFRDRMSSARLGSDVTYTLDAQGNASVLVVNKSYFVNDDTARNFDGMVARLGRPSAESYQKSVEESLKNLSERTGRHFQVADFEASFDRQPEYGAQVYRFRWTGFAEWRDGAWVVDFKGANTVRLNKDSSLTVVLPAGSTLVKAEPAPSGDHSSGRLVWKGGAEMPWPYIEYRP